jgi:DNA sulfur modification protein DndD
LSLGEKQIFAISLLWALTITSGRQLPFIIDTPLGRLDSEHRKKLVKEFFPKSSSQMIIFSTDTEIDLPYFHEMKSSIARSYHLNFDSEEGATMVTPGYFWNEKGEVSV